MKKEIIQKFAERLANMCLKDSSNYNNYSDKDLENATLIFSHFLLDVIWTENQHLSLEKQMELAKTTGKAIYELIKASCGKDMKEIVKSNSSKNI